MKRYYTTELSDFPKAQKLKSFLHDMKIKYQSYQCLGWIHFKILLEFNSEEFKIVSNFLDSL